MHTLYIDPDCSLKGASFSKEPVEHRRVSQSIDHFVDYLFVFFVCEIGRQADRETDRRAGTSLTLFSFIHSFNFAVFVVGLFTTGLQGHNFQDGKGR